MEDGKDFEAVLDVIRYARGRFQESGTIAVIEIDVASCVFWDIAKYVGHANVRHDRRGEMYPPHIILEGIRINFSHVRETPYRKF
jgi:hypothetical protein